LYTDEDISPRSLVVSSKGNVYFTALNSNSIYGILSNSEGTKAESTIEIATDRNCPCSVSLYNGDLYFSEQGTISKISSVDTQLKVGTVPDDQIELVNDQIPIGNYTAAHNDHYLTFDKNGTLYVSVGVPYNDTAQNWSNYIHNTNFGNVLKFGPNEYNESQVYAKGLKYSAGMVVDPFQGGLWFSDIARDGLGQNAPNDELNYAPAAGQNFGYPLCIGCCWPDPLVNKHGVCPNGTVAPTYYLPPHSTPLGIRFYNGSNFPSTYKGDLFVAEHGASVQDQPTPLPNGFLVTRIRMSTTGSSLRVPYASSTFANFTTSINTVKWKAGTDSTTWGRLVDIAFLHDGSMIVSDDIGKAIYRIWYDFE